MNADPPDRLLFIPEYYFNTLELRDYPIVKLDQALGIYFIYMGKPTAILLPGMSMSRW